MLLTWYLYKDLRYNNLLVVLDVQQSKGDTPCIPIRFIKFLIIPVRVIEFLFWAKPHWMWLIFGYLLHAKMLYFALKQTFNISNVYVDYLYIYCSPYHFQVYHKLQQRTRMKRVSTSNLCCSLLLTTSQSPSTKKRPSTSWLLPVWGFWNQGALCENTDLVLYGMKL